MACCPTTLKRAAFFFALAALREATLGIGACDSSTVLIIYFFIKFSLPRVYGPVMCSI
jgi:hypothetical protein